MNASIYKIVLLNKRDTDSDANFTISPNLKLENIF